MEYFNKALIITIWLFAAMVILLVSILVVVRKRPTTQLEPTIQKDRAESYYEEGTLAPACGEFAFAY